MTLEGGPTEEDRRRPKRLKEPGELVVPREKASKAPLRLLMLVPAVDMVIPRLLMEAALLLKVLLDALLLLRRAGDPNTSRLDMPALEILDVAALAPKRRERPKFSRPAAAFAR